MVMTMINANRPKFKPTRTRAGFRRVVGCDSECDVMPLGLDPGLGVLVSSPLGLDRLAAKISRGCLVQERSRLFEAASFAPPVEDELLFRVDALDAVACATGRTAPQLALNGVLQRPMVSSVIIGARDGEQLPQDVGAVGWGIGVVQMAKLNEISIAVVPYPILPTGGSKALLD